MKRAARAGAVGVVLILVLGFAFHFLWYRLLPAAALEAFHRHFFGSTFAGEWAHPEVPKAEDLPFWSAPAAVLAAIGATIILRAGLPSSAFFGGVLGLVLHFPVRPAQYGLPAGRIHLIWFSAGILGAALASLLRRAVVRRQ